MGCFGFVVDVAEVVLSSGIVGEMVVILWWARLLFTFCIFQLGLGQYLLINISDLNSRVFQFGGGC